MAVVLFRAVSDAFILPWRPAPRYPVREKNRSAFLQSRSMFLPCTTGSDLRIFLAVARAGSTLAASRALSLNQTTVSRRIRRWNMASA